MTFSEYEISAKETAIYPGDQGLMYLTLGLCGESGEVAEKVKKIIRDKSGLVSDYDKLLLMQELGDVLWYLTMLANELGSSLEDVAIKNKAKLSLRKEKDAIKGSGDER